MGSLIGIDGDPSQGTQKLQTVDVHTVWILGWNHVFVIWESLVNQTADHFYIIESLAKLDSFINANKKDIPFFNYSNPIKHFYDQTTQSVVTLITRNKKRLQKELSESKELLILLALSTKRELDTQEKKKVKIKAGTIYAGQFTAEINEIQNTYKK